MQSEDGGISSENVGLGLNKRIARLFSTRNMHVIELMLGVVTAGGLKVAAALAAFVLQMVLGKELGVSGTGQYFLAFSIITIIAAASRFGLDNALVRFIAAASARQVPAEVIGVFRLSVRMALTGGIIMTVFVWLLVPFLVTHSLVTPEMSKTLRLMSIGIMPLSISIVCAQALQGLKKIRDALFTLSVATPMLVSLLMMIPSTRIDAGHAALIFVIASTATAVFGYWRWVIATRGHISVRPEFSFSVLMHSCAPLSVVTLLNLIVTWAGVLVVGLFETPVEVGLFSVAQRTALLVSFVLVAVNSIAAPKFSALHATRDIDSLRRIARSSTWMIVTMATPVLMLFLLLPHWVLSLFGNGFSEAAVLLIIMALGQFVNVATGSVGFLLMMTGHERIMRNVLILSAATAVVLNLCLTWMFGVIGAAVATAITVATQNLLAYYYAKKLVL